MSDYIKETLNIYEMGLDDGTLKFYYKQIYETDLPKTPINDILKTVGEDRDNLVKMLQDMSTACITAMEDVLKGREPSELQGSSKKDYLDFKKIKRVKEWVTRLLKYQKITDTEPDPARSVDDEVSTEAARILKEGRPIEYLMEVFHRDYVGGEEYGRLLIFSGLCGTCNNTMGLHPSVDGESGIGKSHAMQAMINLFPPEFVIQGTISPKALFYSTRHNGCTVFLDDVGSMNDEIERLIKISASNYQQGTRHITVHDGMPRDLEFPKCVNWWITGVDAGSFDIQVLNRQVNVSLDEPNRMVKREQKLEVCLHQLKDAVEGRPVFNVTKEVFICREIAGQLLGSEQVNVIIPWIFDEDETPLLNWRDIDNSRNLPIFLDLIRVSASIHRYQRKKTKTGSIIATLEDYDNALRTWSKSSREQLTKLSKKDQLIIQALQDLKADEEPVDLYKLEERMNISYHTLYERLFGRKDKGIQGLLTRYPDITVVEETETRYDQEIYVEGEGSWEKEKTRTKGSKSKKRVLLKLRRKLDLIGISESAVSIDRDKAMKRLENICSTA